jgi:hypothetical protein
MKLKEKENLVQKIGMQFDEAVELFSEETLLSMSMVHIVGGSTNTYCNNAQCVEGCNNNCSSGCGDSGGSTTTTTTTSSGTSIWPSVITGAATVVVAIIGALSK